MGLKTRQTQNEQLCSSMDGREMKEGMTLYSALLWSGNWDRLSQQEDEINEHCRGRGEVTSRTEAGTLITAQAFEERDGSKGERLGGRKYLDTICIQVSQECSHRGCIVSKGTCFVFLHFHQYVTVVEHLENNKEKKCENKIS